MTQNKGKTVLILEWNGTLPTKYGGTGSPITGLSGDLLRLDSNLNLEAFTPSYISSVAGVASVTWDGPRTSGPTPGIEWMMPVIKATWLGTAITDDATSAQDLTNATQCRLITSVQSAGATINTALAVESSTDFAVWNPFITLTIGNTTGIKDSGWLNIPADAKDFVYLRLVGTDGDAVTVPRFSQVKLYSIYYITRRY